MLFLQFYLPRTCVQLSWAIIPDLLKCLVRSRPTKHSLGLGSSEWLGLRPQSPFDCGQTAISFNTFEGLLFYDDDDDVAAIYHIYLCNLQFNATFSLTSQYRSVTPVPRCCCRTLRRSRYTRGRGLVDHYWDRAGRRRFKGSTRLKQSQAYPLRFARAVTLLFYRSGGMVLY